MDSYVPPPRHGRDAPRMYQFGGGDHYSPQGNADSYRRGEFSFRAQGNNQGRQPPRFSQQAHPLPERPANSHNAGVPRGPRRNRGRPGRGQYSAEVRNSGENRRPWQGRPPTSARPLLRGQRARTPEQLLGMNEGEARFKALEDLSDSNEEDMELDSDAEAQPQGSPDRVEEPAHKRLQRTKPTDVEIPTAVQPQWSNPDPYTVLPPPDEAPAKRKDFVKLIRKAKAQAPSAKPSGGGGDDFISFSVDTDDYRESDDDDAVADSVEFESNTGNKLSLRGGYKIPSAPTAPKYSHLNALHGGRQAPGTSAAPILVDDLGPPPTIPKEVEEALGEEKIDIWPPPKSDGPKNEAKGRKRARSEEADVPKRKKKGSKAWRSVDIVPAWTPRKDQNSTPWLTVDHFDCEDVNVRLHKEICDFYDYVKPRRFEEEMRHSLIRRVSRFVRENFESYNAEVVCFGSFAAGTYLPDADMDLVVLSSDFRMRRAPRMGQNKNALFKFANMLQSHGIAKENSTACIWKAKVPIVKYVDRETGLRCDISFENPTGPMANETYKKWKAQYPAMVVLVSIIKQFLLMRGMNEVHSGGLGSFSVNCLVVSLMQHMPQVASGNMKPMENLGEMLLHFLDFYGNKFEKDKIGIQMEPPAYFEKRHDRRVKYNPNSTWKLAIFDPNNRNHDISGGTSNINMIFNAFSAAFKTLQERMNELKTVSGEAEDLGDTSILGPLYAGNYSSFDRQLLIDEKFTELIKEQMSHAIEPDQAYLMNGLTMTCAACDASNVL